MPTSISNPATFNSVRNAFNTEGYGISTSFFAYRQGGGIVPATSAFNQIGAGTVGDPLQLSQFSGFSVPSLYLDLQTVTPDVAIVLAGDFSSVTWFSGYATNNALSGYPIGSITDGTSNLYGGATIEGIFTSDTDPNNPDNDIYVYFYVSGTRSNSGWTSMTIGGFKTYNRASASYSTFGGMTVWTWLDMEGTDPFLTGGGTVEVVWN
jgi:hypothetical protein